MKKIIILSTGLLIITALVICCKKATNPLANTAKMAGAHTWTGTETTIDTTYNYSFEKNIIVVNDQKIVFYNTMNFFSSNGSTISFSCSILTGLNNNYEYDTLTYNYVNNTFIYNGYSDNSGYIDLLNLHSP